MTPPSSISPELSTPLSAGPPLASEDGAPPLRAGDHLSVEEFERRYEAMPDLKKAELINGVVYMSPVIDEMHARPHARLITMLGVYEIHTPNVLLGDNSSIKGLEGANQPQPDCVMRILPERGGQTTTDAKGYVEGAPELVAEVSYSSKSYDLHEKKETYRANGVREYLVWCVGDSAIQWFRLVDGQYEVMQPDALGILKSEVFPGLWLDAASLLNGDALRVFKVVQQGIASAEHQAFVQELQRRRADEVSTHTNPEIP